MLRYQRFDWFCPRSSASTLFAILVAGSATVACSSSGSSGAPGDATNTGTTSTTTNSTVAVPQGGMVVTQSDGTMVLVDDMGNLVTDDMGNVAVVTGMNDDGTVTVQTNTPTMTTGGGGAGTTTATAGGGTTTASGGAGNTMSGGSGGAADQGNTLGTGGADGVMRDCDVQTGMISDFEEGEPIVSDQEGWTGEWGEFYDAPGNMMTQVEASGEGAECSEFALHTSGSGYAEYVGLGFQLLGTDMAPQVYDGSEWAGIRFRAKVGPNHDMSSPVRFNVSTPWTEGTDSGGECSTGDCYNHLGRFFAGEHALTQEWKTFTFCFDRDLYPLFLPSDLSVAQRDSVAANILKIQFQFNKSKDLSAQAADGQELPEKAATLPFDFWLDDIQFVTEGCAEPSFQSSAGTSAPFPQNQAPGSCSLPSNVERFNAALADVYERWKSSPAQGGFVDGGRVVAPEQDNITTSEAMGYGMMIAAAMGDQALFDQFWGHVQSFVGGSTPSNLMDWNSSGGAGSATDGDLDIAYALLMAEQQWGGYAAAANAMISLIGSQDVSAGHLNPGNNWNNDSLFNPSYFAPSYLRVFSGGAEWSSVLSGSYTALNNCDQQMGGSNGLVPDWCNVSGETLDPPGQVQSGLGRGYTFDAARTPWRVGLDACLFGDSSASQYVSRFVSTLKGMALHENGARIDLMKAGYDTSGQPFATSRDNQASFIGPAAVGAQAAGDTVMFERGFRAVLDIVDNPEFNRTYFPTTLGVITLLHMSGNFPHVTN